MQAPLTAASLLRHAPAEKTSPSAAPEHAPAFAAPAGSPAAVDSSALLQGQKAVAISHNGAVYRLQATKLGKLILTK